MKLTKFSITNYRSITKAHKINISALIVLVGKNNEGKSNILKALNVAMNALQEHALVFRRRRVIHRYTSTRREERYFWKRDFPVALQERKQGTQSIFRLEFELDDAETDEFKQVIGSNLNGILPLVIKFGKDNKPIIDIAKQGRGAKTLSGKSGKIAQFIAEKIYFNYIPAVRTDQEAIRIIREMLSSELSVLEKEDEYLQALETISKLQQPILASLEQKIKEPLSEFLPNIENVHIEISEVQRMTSLRRDVELIIDDGSPTSIEYKGDGVKSLATLALLKDKYSTGGASIIAIEEPESHLHPAAIHQLRDIIVELSKANQVIISSHNPLFVDRHNITSNIIINERTAKPARSIKEIRELLGVQASDNLVNANYVLVVEGADDVISLKALLPVLSRKLSTAINSNTLVIEEIGGASNLAYKLSMLANALCISYILLDNDKAGIEAYDKALSKGFITAKDCTFITCNGMRESEFEDTLQLNVYIEAIRNKFGVDLDTAKFRNASKWSDRVGVVFRDQGKLWNNSVEANVKYTVAERVNATPRNALNQHKRNSIDALVKSLEIMMG